MIRAVLFDLDNTLIDRDAAFHQFCQESLDRFWPGLDAAERTLALARMAHRDRTYLMRDVSPKAIPMGDYRFGVDRDWADQPRDWHQQIWSEAWDAEKRRRLPHLIELEASVEQLIRRLRGRFRLAIVTNGSVAVQSAKLHTTRIADLFDHVVISEEIGISKPDPRIFENALSRLNCVAKEALFVGDDPERDVVGAKRVGMLVAWVRRDREWTDLIDDEGRPVEYRPDYLVNHVSELEASVACLMRTN